MVSVNYVSGIYSVLLHGRLPYQLPLQFSPERAGIGLRCVLTPSRLEPVGGGLCLLRTFFFDVLPL